jgi:hypothetical protein
MFITNLTVSGGDANDLSSVNCPLSIFSNACLAASSTGSAFALVERSTFVGHRTNPSYIQFNGTCCLYFLDIDFLRFNLATFIVGERLAQYRSLMNTCHVIVRLKLAYFFLRYFIGFGSDNFQCEFGPFSFNIHFIVGYFQILL